MKVLCLIVDENTDFPGVHKLSAINSEEIGDESGCKTCAAHKPRTTGSGLALFCRPYGVDCLAKDYGRSNGASLPSHRA